nr:hypothetical protein [Acidobacteriota bacterium]
VHDPEVMDALESDLRLATQMRSLAQITPAVAHDLRAPINAMVLNLEVLKETLAAQRPQGPGAATVQQREMRYVNVLKEELARLHRSLEIFLSHASPRGDRSERLDLREPLADLAALLVPPGRKQQIQVSLELPDSEMPVHGNRYLLRQALLHVGLAALATVPTGGTLAVRLTGSAGGRARITLGPTHSGQAAVQDAGAAGFELRFSPAGTLAQLHVARSLLASQEGSVRSLGNGAGGGSGGEEAGFEVDLRLLNTQ